MIGELVVTGMGAVSAIGAGKALFRDGLFEGRQAFGVMQRPGRQQSSAFLGAEIADIPLAWCPPRLQAASLSVRAALFVLHEAWEEAGLASVEGHRIGLVVGGSNVQQREIAQLQARYRDRQQFLPPSYALSFSDSDLCGYCTQQFGIRGVAFTCGAGPASGQMAIVQAAQLLLTGQVDACVVVGALMDLSHWECQAFRALGAMGSDRFAAAPAQACRPFDQDREGFIFGECSGALVLERAAHARNRGAAPIACLAGWGVVMDGNRDPSPSLDGEVHAIRTALGAARWSASNVEYVNPHGSGSVLGDSTELLALHECGLRQARINATKSLIGHGLTAAGTVEVVATLLQMQAGRLHPTRNLERPVDPDFAWVTGSCAEHRFSKALTLSMGFGGVNTALCWEGRS